jgi:hypothetical protein
VTGRQGRKRRKLLDDLKGRRGYSYLKEEALDRTMWRARFGRGFGPVVRQTTKLTNTGVITCFGPKGPSSSNINTKTQNYGWFIYINDMSRGKIKRFMLNGNWSVYRWYFSFVDVA